MPAAFRRAWPWLSIVARLVVGVVWIVAGALKITDLDTSALSVQAYDVMPIGLAHAIGYALPFLELAIGVFLVLGLAIRMNAILSAVLLIAFIAGISQAWARGLKIDCGCFGSGGYAADATEKYPWEIARDIGLLLLSGALAVWPLSKLSLDAVLMPAAYADDTDDDVFDPSVPA